MLFKKKETIRKDYLLRKIRKLYKDGQVLQYSIGYNSAIKDIINIIEKSNN